MLVSAKPNKHSLMRLIILNHTTDYWLQRQNTKRTSRPNRKRLGIWNCSLLLCRSRFKAFEWLLYCIIWKVVKEAESKRRESKHAQFTETHAKKRRPKESSESQMFSSFQTKRNNSKSFCLDTLENSDETRWKIHYTDKWAQSFVFWSFSIQLLFAFQIDFITDPWNRFTM